MSRILKRGSGLDFKDLVTYLKQTLQKLPDKRQGQNSRYGMDEAGLGALSVFFTQNPSFLAFQQMMQASKGKSNAQSLFQIEKIPSDNQIRNLLYEVDPKQVAPVFSYVLEQLKQAGEIQRWRGLNKQVLIALDGTQYFRSSKIHCRRCTKTEHKNGRITYSHQAILPVLVAPEEAKVLPLIPAWVRAEDGQDKQDCETNAAKRWLAAYGKEYAQLDATLLGDDLYAHQPLCQEMLKAGFDFILVCKPESHKTLYEWLQGVELETLQVKRWTGKRHEIDTYRWLNQVPLRDSEDALLVNWCELVTTDRAGKVLYKNSFASSHEISKATVEAIARAGRARWKVENETYNVLKTNGYHLEHNYGHGKNYLAAFMVALNTLAFLFHTVLELIDEKYRMLRQKIARRKTFFNDLKALTRYICFESWEALMDFMMRGLELSIADTS
jgi:hypothetical protein